MIIRISLLLILNSVTVFIVADFSARLGFHGLSDSLTLLGSAVLLSAFALLIGKGLLAIVKAILLSVADYFSSRQRSQRQIFFIQSRQDQANRLFYFKTLQMRYWTRQKINQLLNRNNRQQLQSLSKAIQKDLLVIKKNIPCATFKQLHQEHISHRDRQDIEALLKLQQKISTFV